MTTIRIRNAKKATVEELGKAKLGKWASGPGGLVEVHIYGQLRAVVAFTSGNGKPNVIYVEEAYKGQRAAIATAAAAAHTLSGATAGIWGNGQGNA